MQATSDLPGEALRLAEEFPPVSTEAWEAVIKADLAGADYDKKLVWNTEEGIAVRPYYRADDVQPRPALLIGAAKPDVLIDAARFAENGGTTVQELGYGIGEGLRKRASGVGSIGFVLSVGSNFFFEIAKLRAARILWAEATGEPVWIEARTSLSNKSIYAPYTNLLRTTTEAMSARIGGADALQVVAFGFTERLARNVDRIIAEEAHLNDTLDPAAGAYYVEVLTDSIAAEARKLFDATPESIDQAIAASRVAKEKAIASRRKVMVGVNNYPDIGETLVGDEYPVPSDVWRAAAVFEQIRLRSDRHAAKTGKRPTVLLLQRGDLKMRQARAQFIQNFFGCGGFAIVEADHLEGSPDLIVLCSSDPEYPALAQEICPQAKQPVVVAGNPKDQMDVLNAAGVAGYVHVLSNAVETLKYWQDKLNIGVEV
ncbi:MAG: methylmalonyl-CoA mutase family protein [Bryobacteraceae bacterium]|nr:methylmalonyl-CoA mutase family protein [Bryobacteraceae bacterium]